MRERPVPRKLGGEKLPSRKKYGSENRTEELGRPGEGNKQRKFAKLGDS